MAERVHSRLIGATPIREPAWALRVGTLSGRLIQVETVLEKGCEAALSSYVREAVPEARVIAVGAAHGVLDEEGPDGAFFAGFNYVFCPRRPDLHLRAAVDALGGDVEVHRLGDYPTLCLRRPARFLAPSRSWRFTEQGASTLPDTRRASSAAREVRLVEALARGDASLAGGRTSLILGLRTPEHGCVHLAELVVQLDAAALGWQAYAHLEVSGAHNALRGQRQSGPSTWVFQGKAPRAPALSDVAWPY